MNLRGLIGLAVTVGALWMFWPTISETFTEPDTRGGLPVVQLSSLPRQATETVELIDAGGPFPYPEKDGSRFSNFEGILPDSRDGYYREYTVPTPGSDDRGARRIVAGNKGELYWTEDHYSSFERIKR